MTASISDRQIDALNRIASALDRIATALHYGVKIAPQDAFGAATSGPAPSGGTPGGSSGPEAPQDAPQEFDLCGGEACETTGECQARRGCEWGERA
jgi:hypothetical protein